MDIICVTQRQLCADIISQITKIARAKPKYIILREKDMTERDYADLAEKIQVICRRYKVPLICNTFFGAAAKIGADGIHLPLHIAKKGGYVGYGIFGISVHSPEEAVEAEKLGADYITFGHIFPTDCKKGLEPRGTELLKKVCECVDIPVYAIGGITAENAASVKTSSAKGVCLMSSLMKADEPSKIIERIRSV